MLLFRVFVEAYEESCYFSGVSAFLTGVNRGKLVLVQVNISRSPIPTRS